MGDVSINVPMMKAENMVADVTDDKITIFHGGAGNTDHTNVELATVETDSQTLIAEVCDEIKEMLLEKNRKYGDSALNPTRIFAKSDSVEQIKVRIDDKLNRMKNAQDDEDEDIVLDLMGYLVLLRVAQQKVSASIKEQAEEATISVEDWLKLIEKNTQPYQPYIVQPVVNPGPYVLDAGDWWQHPTVTFTTNVLDDGHDIEV